MRPIGLHGGKVMYIGSFCVRDDLVFLNCNDICMCVVNKFLFLIPFMLTCSMMRFL